MLEFLKWYSLGIIPTFFMLAWDDFYVFKQQEYRRILTISVSRDDFEAKWTVAEKHFANKLALRVTALIFSVLWPIGLLLRQSKASIEKVKQEATKRWKENEQNQ